MESPPPSPINENQSPGEIGIPSKEERTLTMLCHLLPLIGCLFPAVPVLNIVAPLILWLVKKDTMPFLNSQGKEVLNFQITLSIVFFVCFLTFWLILPIAIAFVAGIAGLILMILAAIQVNEGKAYRYPFTLRLIK